MDIKVNIVNDFSFGANTHTLLIPPAPPVPTVSVEMFATQLWTLGYLLNQNKLTTKVTHKDMRIVLDGHDCGVMIPDVTIPPVNAYYPLIWPFSSRKIAFSASLVQMEGTATGCADMAAGLPLPMMTCGNPISAPTAIVLSNVLNTVVVGMTPWDVFFGYAGIVASILVDVFAGPGSGNDYVDALFPVANLRKFGYGILAGVVVSGARCLATRGEYPVSVTVQPTGPYFGYSFQASWSNSTGFQFQHATYGAGYQQNNQYSSTGTPTVTQPNQQWGRPLTGAPEGARWNAARGWTR
jgi:hypothetical protein